MPEIIQTISSASLELSLMGIAILSLIFAMTKPLSSSKTTQNATTVILGISIIVSFALNIYQYGSPSILTVLVMISLIYILLFHASYSSSRISNYSVYFLVTCSAVGTLFAIKAHDFLSLYLSFETISFVGYIMVALLIKKPLTSESAVKYYIIGGVSSAIMLFGISFIYGTSNSIDFSQISTSTFATLGIVLFLCGILFKLTAFPFHFWAPDVYSTTSLPTLSIIATLPKIAALIAFINILSHVQNELILATISFVAIFSMAIGSVGGVFQTHVNRILAYSGIANIGYILTLYTTPNFAMPLYEFTTIYITGTLFLIAILLMIQINTAYNGKIESLQNLHKTSPFLAFLLMVALLNTAGIPPLSGFFAKYIAIKHLLQQGNLLMPFAIVISSVIAVFYYLKVIKNIYMGPSENTPPSTQVHIPFIYLFGLLALLAFVMLYFAFEYNSFYQYLINNTVIVVK